MAKTIVPKAVYDSVNHSLDQINSSYNMNYYENRINGLNKKIDELNQEKVEIEKTKVFLDDQKKQLENWLAEHTTEEKQQDLRALCDSAVKNPPPHEP
jgi:septal ring factor EnvC (AmiA/AmiB activator)